MIVVKKKSILAIVEAIKFINLTYYRKNRKFKKLIFEFIRRSHPEDYSHILKCLTYNCKDLD